VCTSSNCSAFHFFVHRLNHSLLYKHICNVLVSRSILSFFFKFVKSACVHSFWCSYFLFFTNRGFALPSKISTETVLRSAHSNKKSREQFSICLYRRGFSYPPFLSTSRGYLLRKIMKLPPGASFRHSYNLSS